MWMHELLYNILLAISPLAPRTHAMTQPSLQMLREAKERAENQAKEEEEFTETRKAHFGAQFDEFQGEIW